MTLKVDPIFGNMVKAAKMAAEQIEQQRLSDREITRRLGASDKVRFMILEDSKLRASKRKHG